ncbi:hypothetical protein CO151_09460 [bacterium CG_4_9_14_3_um_filter_65_15]|nr:MAG: hypothetical protein CO151_09460 [bacterium CG_4_9_14_3_um_filter_65_15]
MKKLLFLLVMVVLGAGSALSVSLPPTSPHGLLVDRALPMAHLDKLDGSAAAPAVGIHRWRQALWELRASSENPSAWPDPRGVQPKAYRDDRHLVPLGLIHATYDRMREDGTLAAGEIFTVAALRPAVYDGAAVEFALDERRQLDRGPATVKALRLDPGDGGGWRTIRPGRTVRAGYAHTGKAVVRVEADLSDGRTLHAATAIQVKALVTPDPTETWPITATESYGGALGSGRAYIYLSDQHTVLTNPVVVVEGFDLDNTMDWPVLYDLLNQQDMIEELRAQGLDAVVLDFTEATDPIQRNAFVLTALLEQVRQTVGPNRTMTLIGASMGGLVSRYALLWSEQQGIAHQVRTWISFDSPQKGAVIPLGLQEWLDFFRNQSVDAQLLLSSLDSPASKQMLLYHHTNPALTPPGPAPDFPAFQSELDALGGWPAVPRRVSVVNGSGQGVDQGFAPGDQLVDYTYRSFLVDIDGNVWAVPDAGELRIFQGHIDKIWPLPDQSRNIHVQSTAPWDGAPGGYRSSLAQMDTTAVDYGDIIALHDNHCFIPVVSALALDSDDPFFDIAGAPDLMSLTPFDEVHYPAENQEHVLITPENKPWFMNAILQGVSGIEELPVAGGPALSLAAPYPNPFNPRTTLRAELTVSATVSLEIFDVRGRLVATLADGERVEAGARQWTWDGRGDDGGTQAAGVYQARLRGAGVESVRTLVLVK